MSTTLITNISEAFISDAAHTLVENAAILIDGQDIAWIGEAGQAPEADTVIDAGQRAALPGWVDSHSHLVFAGDRSREFVARMAGQDYAAGGIAVTTKATRATTDYDLTRLVMGRAAEALAGGTTYLETKTGYGLNVEEEARHARIASAVVDQVTFLGAHLVPADMDAQEYTDLVCGEMLERVLPFVQFADVFCERGAFNEAQSRQVLAAAKDAGLGLRVHGNQLGPGPGTKLAVEFGAASVDHVNFLDEQDVAALAGSWADWDAQSRTGTAGTVATCLPACDLSTRMPFAPGRELIDAGVQIALASNCNPGTSYTSSMAFCVSTAVLQMHLSIEEAIVAATYGGALALGVQDRVGSLEVGKRADIQLLNAPSVAHLAYRPGMNLSGPVFRAGELASGRF
ncbi:imidazolonepropionase [Arthrobacter sp. YC-RL1]|uniref:imidazolonepropionase n=1 Tax=unclassified Arthrobacter TaxID=235627 RepID=UPI00063D9221|nr:MULTISPECIES: imidazolonepropionase [unclassified Arthrobacter]ALQ31485.1 imidazolonepropionase [Arthrobacter sp. YC-RL1]KLI90033.1 imidazolonepropionase [Arthrobacter sp. YC-RL1]RKS20838.1 imidazolonepropionase [Arthrobacter sp. AG1021]